jgi:chloramphenicol 3-O-phosphotransferase
VKHIIFYGPPGSGKLSIARELAKVTGYHLLHNQLTNDLVREVFPYGHPEFSRLVIDFRSDMYEAAARARVEGIISTFVYGRGTVDDKILKGWIRLVDSYGGETLFVRVHCSQKTLFKRIAAPRRRETRKITSLKQLKLLMKNSDILSPIPFVASLEVDTDHLKPVEATKMVKKHFRL